MPYTKTAWVNGVAPALSAANLNNLETQYDKAKVIVAETEVFNGNSPNPFAWTDLDLSAVVGANHALVLLKFRNENGAAKNTAFRPNGDTDSSFRSIGCAAGNAGGNLFAHFIITTDAAGIVEWIYEQAAEAGTTIDVVAYIAGD